MTSRECILATFDHKTPDKVPVDPCATPSSGISAIAYTHLKNCLQGHYFGNMVRKKQLVKGP